MTLCGEMPAITVGKQLITSTWLQLLQHLEVWLGRERRADHIAALQSFLRTRTFNFECTALNPPDKWI